MLDGSCLIGQYLSDISLRKWQSMSRKRGSESREDTSIRRGWKDRKKEDVNTFRLESLKVMIIYWSNLRNLVSTEIYNRYFTLINVIIYFSFYQDTSVDNHGGMSSEWSRVFKKKYSKFSWLLSNPLILFISPLTLGLTSISFFC